jgi:hypothetical protein
MFLNTVDKFGNALRGAALIRVCESSNPSFNKISFPSKLLCGNPFMSQPAAFSSHESAPVSVAITPRSSTSSQLLIESWFLNGPVGLSSTYYVDCAWSSPLESLISSMPLFRPIGSAVLNDKGLYSVSGTHPCSVQWSGLLQLPLASQNTSLSFELGSSAGSCLTMFINDAFCCATCHHGGYSRNGRHGHRRTHAPCKCTIHVTGSSVAQYWPLALYGNSDGEDPNWRLKWFSSTAHLDAFEHIKDTDVVPTSTGGSNVKVFPGTHIASNAQLSFLTRTAALPAPASCAFRSAQPRVPRRIAALPSLADDRVLSAVHGVKPRSALELIFDCKDDADNAIALLSSSSVRVSSFILAAPRSPSSPVWCCNEKDLVASVSQDALDHSFTAFASFSAPGNNFIVPAVISAGAFFELSTLCVDCTSHLIRFRRHNCHVLQCR